jgi:hypothetical protein
MSVQRLDYTGRRFRPRGSGGGPTSVGHYHQDSDLVWAEFSGPTVPVGRLVGNCDAAGVITAAYCMVTTAGETIAGTVRTTPTVLDDGRIELTEHWRRMDGSTGVSHLEEIVE